MKLIKQLNANLLQMSAARALQEDAAGGAVSGGGGDVAANAMPLFAQLVKRSKKAPKSTAPVIRTATSGLGIAEAFKFLSEVEGDEMSTNPPAQQNKFDPAAVIAKMKGLEQKEEHSQRNTTTFGLQDEEDGIVRVTVPEDQAEDFERALQTFIASTDEDQTPEIAEILFKLKDQFDIIDTVWPTVEQDEEQVMSLEGDEDGDEAGDEAGDPNANPDDMDMSLDPADGINDSPAGDTGQVTDLLTQVIDMMKADAEARKAEARAREAEAKTKEADAVVSQSTARVKQEEQYLDMDTYNKARKDEDREAKRLAQLAKWKHDMSNTDRDVDDDDAGSSLKRNLDVVPEEEESVRTRPMPKPPASKPPARTPQLRGRVAPHDIASFILDRVK